MPIHDIIHEHLLDDHSIAGFRQRFDEGVPFRHLVIDNFLSGSFAGTILHSFPPLEAMKTHYTGINERKAEDNNFEKLDKSFTLLHEALSSPVFLKWIGGVTGIGGLSSLNDRLGYGLHQGGDGSFLDIHIDYNIHPVSRLQRRLNFLLFFNPDWQEAWGGALELWDLKTKKSLQHITPLFNRAVIFECSESSYHGYSRINVPPDITRKSYYQYYFTQPEEAIHFHDTMFRPMAGDPWLKKIAVPVKEFLKNSAKKVLLRIGFEKFLK